MRTKPRARMHGVRAQLGVVSMLLALAACGGRTDLESASAGAAGLDSTTGGADAIAAEAGADSNEDGSVRRCPPAETPCTNIDEICEDGSSPNPFCNPTVYCGADMRWTMLSRDSCRPTESTAAKCPAEVPAVDSVCDVAGRCLFPTSKSGGAALCQCFSRWECERATCPLPRPLLGTPCAVEGSRCDFGRCDSVWGFWLAQVCRSGRWIALERVVC